jgi:hypothetical protein
MSHGVQTADWDGTVVAAMVSQGSFWSGDAQIWTDNWRKPMVLLINVGVFLIVMVPVFCCQTFGWLDRGRANVVRWPLSVVLACYLVWYVTWSCGNAALCCQGEQLMMRQEALVLIDETAGKQSPVASPLREYHSALAGGVPPAEAITALCERLRAIADPESPARPTEKREN